MLFAVPSLVFQPISIIGTNHSITVVHLIGGSPGVEHKFSRIEVDRNR